MISDDPSEIFCPSCSSSASGRMVLAHGETMYAVIKTGGQQFKVAPGDTIQVDRLKTEAGENLEFDAMLVSNGDDVTVGFPTVDGAKVAVEVVRHLRGEKIVVFRYKRRKNQRKKKGFRADLTELKITGITGC